MQITHLRWHYLFIYLFIIFGGRSLVHNLFYNILFMQPSNFKHFFYKFSFVRLIVWGVDMCACAFLFILYILDGEGDLLTTLTSVNFTIIHTCVRGINRKKRRKREIKEWKFHGIFFKWRFKISISIKWNEKMKCVKADEK